MPPMVETLYPFGRPKETNYLGRQGKGIFDQEERGYSDSTTWIQAALGVPPSVEDGLKFTRTKFWEVAKRTVGRKVHREFDYPCTTEPTSREREIRYKTKMWRFYCRGRIYQSSVLITSEISRDHQP
ncbi:hypothetical protein C8R42DRAFT_637389 [Lentinula raphanica]|nr:hypothetical protein C8R42DRAFT_637389 [Lentinula raphanica]